MRRPLPLALALLLGSSCGGDAPPSQDAAGPEASATPSAGGVTAAEAVEAAAREHGTEWQLTALSNAGVVGGSVAAAGLHGPAEALMRPDGQAGQWVVEVFRDAPTPVSQGGRSGFAYPLRRFAVTAADATELPESEVAVPQRLAALPADCLAGLDDARALALRENGARFDG